MKKTYKIYLVIITLTIILFSLTTKIYAAIDTEGYNPGDVSSSEYEDVVAKVAPVIKVLLTVGVIVGAVGITLLGLRYMLGSIEEKAEYKETMMPFLFGAIFIFSISAILRLIANIF